MEAKIAAVAPAYAALVRDGTRRSGLGPANARRELGKGLDTQSDGVVWAYFRLLDTEFKGYRMSDDHRFAFPSLEKGARPEFWAGGGGEVAPQ